LQFIAAQPTQMAHFQHVQSILIVSNVTDSNSNSSPNSTAKQSNKSVLHLRISGASEVLAITCPSNNTAENIADLIDGYCRLINNTNQSFWVKKGIKFDKTCICLLFPFQMLA
jgi:focal adhesion kinase 1